MQAFARRGLEAGTVGLFVMPGTKRGAGFHGREDVHQPRMLTALGKDGLDAFFLAKRLEPADELDLEAGLCGKRSACWRNSSRSGSAQRGKSNNLTP